MQRVTEGHVRFDQSHRGIVGFGPHNTIVRSSILLTGTNSFYTYRRGRSFIWSETHTIQTALRLSFLYEEHACVG